MSYGAKAAERLANKIVLITGASSGIGAATARELAAASKGNIRLILAARRDDRLAALSKLLIREFPSVKIHNAKLDVSVTDAVKPFLSSLPKEFADIDVLINNAGKALGLDLVGNLKQDDIEGMFQTNVLGLINMTQEVLPILKKKNAGDIINIGSIAGKDAYPYGSVYCASKAGVKYFSNALRKELIDTRIRVLEIDPGAVNTEFSLVRFHGDHSKADNVYQGTTPLDATDIAELIVFGMTRKENTVVAEMTVFPNHQASSTHIYRRPPT